jgi:hypothetical protein
MRPARHAGKAFLERVRQAADVSTSTYRCHVERGLWIRVAWRRRLLAEADSGHRRQHY